MNTNPLLSIIVPCFKVEAYLHQCLDSLLGQDFKDFEVIAVDDRSPDRSGRILDDYAGRDPRVRVLHLEENQGLGGARNAGLAQARGRYVWFVDSDDWIAEDCLSAIADRIAAVGDPDVLVVDYARAFWDGRVIRNELAPLFAEGAAPEAFTIDAYQELLKVFPSAWNKVIRREFLTEIDLPYPTGFYEDVPVTFPLLARAERITLLDKVCLYYRQRRHSSILKTAGAGHLAVFDQYDLTMNRLLESGERGALLEPKVFEHAIWHGFLILGNRTRVAGAMRERFFRRMARFYREHLPAGGYDVPAGREGLQHRLLAKEAWGRFRATRAVFLGARALGRGLVKRPLGKLEKTAKKLLWKLKLAYYRSQLRRPLDENLAVYSIYWGRGYGCNPGAIYEEAARLAPEVKGVWVVERGRGEAMPEGVEAVVSGSFAYFKALARAKYTFNNVNFADHVRKREGSVHVQTHHGVPVKVMGVDQKAYPVGRGQNFWALLRRCDRWDYSLSVNDYTSRVWQSAYPCDYATLEYGQPRNDRLVRATDEERRRIRAGLGLDPDDRVVLYAPTYRDHEPARAARFDPARLVTLLGPGTRVLLRGHHFENAAKYEAQSDIGAAIVNVSDHPDIADLYIAADHLVTDYSSVMFDFAVLDRPITLLAPDWDSYRAIRGSYLDIHEDGPGLVCASMDELCEAFATGEATGQGAEERRRRFRARFLSREDGRASERVVRKVFLGEEPELAPAREGEGALDRALANRPLW
ncbi:bifunctional glycosyltransferase family 2 protein/CDP-glycerol:glycerophosphate glycerophosphotransferase [Glycomyces sp. NPDC046736]|uniref:bifunctional glycosyltransferase/CDP-glycerol:glycerophosphate glycerophosphotransferase n=1 Tax=Glycomyces sp. NPDC046736 TaxID=3155615 RepID=UPI0033D76275